MDLDFSSEQTLLRDTVSRLCAQHCDIARVRALEDDARGCDEGVWHALAALGLCGIAIPEAHGGAGQGLLDCVLVMEEFGRAMAPSPWFGSCVLAARAIALAGSDAQQTAWLPRIARGEAVIACAWQAPGASPDARQPACFVDAGGRLHGRATLVPFAGSATDFLVPARDGEATVLLLVPAAAPGIGITALPNHARLNLAAVVFDGVALDAATRIDGARADAAWVRALREGMVVAAAESAGGAARVLELAVAYAKERQQFGQPIGAFQALAHDLANRATEVEGARYLVYHAAWAADAGHDFARLAPAAKLQAGDAYLRASDTSVHVHGGLGFSLDADPQLHYRRARHQQLMFGDPAWLERQIAAGVLDR
jgi:alkylation response protein AidB-like acyl-CoA dehydrogenase